MRNAHRTLRDGSRRGALLLEVTLAMATLAVVFVAVAHLLAIAVQQQRETELRTLAAREAANVMERVAARPWSALTAEELAALRLDEDVARRLPEARLRVEVDDAPRPLDARRIRVAIDWRSASGARCEPIQLVTWRFRAAAP